LNSDERTVLDSVVWTTTINTRAYAYSTTLIVHTHARTHNARDPTPPARRL